MADGGVAPADRLRYGFRLAVARQPSDRELTVLTKQLEEQQAHFAAHPDEAGKLLSVGEAKMEDGMEPAELAAYTMLANLILNLDETITKE
jgi:hypothetical protein